LIDTGGSYGSILEEETIFNASKSIGVEGEVIDYNWDFGDNTNGNGVIIAHKYIEKGKYTVTLTITDNKSNKAIKSTNVWVQEINEPPNKPTIQGSNQGNIGIPYEFIFSSNDNDGNDIWYSVDWGDGLNTGWIGPYKEGEKIILDHSWNMIGKYSIKTMVKDVFDDESQVETLSIQVKIPISKAVVNINSFLMKLLFYFPFLNNLIKI
jgi:hypothetical protein